MCNETIISTGLHNHYKKITVLQLKPPALKAEAT